MKNAIVVDRDFRMTRSQQRISSFRPVFSQLHAFEEPCENHDQTNMGRKAEHRLKQIDPRFADRKLGGVDPHRDASGAPLMITFTRDTVSRALNIKFTVTEPFHDLRIVM
jgi:hypothetical protein